ncbi:MAG TPA: hypothetical protein VMU17_02165, partial [Elusimicrobiota bacterium]|nr:hypothetical protein [Elusimicrobiota bacterium]
MTETERSERFWDSINGYGSPGMGLAIVQSTFNDVIVVSPAGIGTLIVGRGVQRATEAGNPIVVDPASLLESRLRDVIDRERKHVVEVQYNEPLLRELIRVYGSLDDLRDRDGIELGAQAHGLRPYLEDRFGAIMRTVGAADVFGRRVNKRMDYPDRRTFYVGEYNQYFREVPDNSIDFVVARKALYPYGTYHDVAESDYGAIRARMRNPHYRSEALAKRYRPLARILKPGGVILSAIMTQEDFLLPSHGEIRSFGLETLARYETPSVFDRSLTVLTLRKPLSGTSSSKDAPVSGGMSYSVKDLLNLLFGWKLTDAQYRRGHSLWAEVALAAIAAGMGALGYLAIHGHLPGFSEFNVAISAVFFVEHIMDWIRAMRAFESADYINRPLAANGAWAFVLAAGASAAGFLPGIYGVAGALSVWFVAHPLVNWTTRRGVPIDWASGHPTERLLRWFTSRLDPNDRSRQPPPADVMQAKALDALLSGDFGTLKTLNATEHIPFEFWMAWRDEVQRLDPSSRRLLVLATALGTASPDLAGTLRGESIGKLLQNWGESEFITEGVEVMHIAGNELWKNAADPTSKSQYAGVNRIVRWLWRLRRLRQLPQGEGLIIGDELRTCLVVAAACRLAALPTHLPEARALGRFILEANLQLREIRN